jgi:hypothetical protein
MPDETLAPKPYEPPRRRQTWILWGVGILLVLGLAATLILLAFAGSCRRSTRQPESTAPASSGFGIYIVKGGADLPYSRKVALDITAVALEEAPVISGRDISEYEWRTHVIRLVPGVEKRISRPDATGVPYHRSVRRDP